MLFNPHKAGGEGVLVFKGTEIQRGKGETEIPNGRGRRALVKESALEHGDFRPKALDWTSAPSWPSSLGKSQGLGEPASLLSNGIMPHLLRYLPGGRRISDWQGSKAEGCLRHVRATKGSWVPGLPGLHWALLRLMQQSS